MQLLDADLASELPLQGTVRGKNVTFERFMQGPLTDAMTHVGQLAMLRHLAGSPIEGETFIAADIEPGTFTLD